MAGGKRTVHEKMKSRRLSVIATTAVVLTAFTSPASAGLFVLNAEGTLSQQTFPPTVPFTVPDDPALLEGATFRVTVSGDATQPPASGGPGGGGGAGFPVTYDDFLIEVSLTNRPGGAADVSDSTDAVINLFNAFTGTASSDRLRVSLGALPVIGTGGGSRLLEIPNVTADFGSPDFFPGGDAVPQLPAFDFVDVTPISTSPRLRYDADDDGDFNNDFSFYLLNNISISSQVFPSQVVPEPSMLLTWIGLTACGLPLRRRRGLRS